LYATLSVKNTAKKNKYKEPMHQMLDRILKVGRNEHGLFYNQINPITGEHSEGLADTFGYNLNGFYTVYLIDNKKDYRQATLFALSNLRDHYQNYNWENGSADGYADAIEGALNLYNREPLPGTKIWIDTEIQYMWNIQKPDGIIEGWHGDGNFARTSIMYALWKTKGLTITPWDKNIVFGAKMDKDNLYITLYSDKAWQAVLMFDKPRHRLYSKLPFDYPRINQFPEWFTAEPDKMYSIFFNSMENQNKFSGQDLINGIPVQLEPGTNYTIFVKPL
jgi:hypothetical protein